MMLGKFDCEVFAKNSDNNAIKILASVLSSSSLTD